MPHPLSLFAAAGVVAAMLALLLYLNPAQLGWNKVVFLPDPAHPLASAVHVEGAQAAPADGGAVYYVDVLERRATWLDRLFPPDGATFYNRAQLGSSGQSDSAVRQQDLRMMSHSQRVAEYVAARAAGYKARAIPRGVFVDDVYPQSPADGKLFPADVIVSVDGKPTLSEPALRKAIHARPAGSRLVFQVRRGKPARTVVVPVGTILDQRQNAPVVGIVPEDEVDVTLPRKLRISIDIGSVGGPSAGLPFTLQLLQALGRDVDHGYKVAATGTIAFNGAVGAIGGVKQKTLGARKAGVDVFLVPTDGGNAAEAKRYAGTMRVIPVKSFQQALHALATLPEKG